MLKMFIPTRQLRVFSVEHRAKLSAARTKHRFTDDELKASALKFKTRMEWCKNENAAWKFARYKRGKEFYELCCSHMPEKIYIKFRSQEMRDKIRLKLKGRKHSAARRLNISAAKRGKTISLEGRRKLSLAARQRVINSNQKMAVGIDEGATEYFNSLNNARQFNIKHPNVFFSELGYYADGFDLNQNVWFEFDTPRHLNEKVKRRDELRQTDIIKYFERIGKPLKAFYRIDATTQELAINPTMKNIIASGA